jgi:hypothetical protein
MLTRACAITIQEMTVISTDSHLGKLRVLSLVSLLFFCTIDHIHAENVETKPASDATNKNTPAFTIHVSPDGWGQAQPRDIEQLLVTVARDIRANFGDLPKRVLMVEHGNNTPITLFKCVIRLTSVDLRWAQFSYQFAHELCHVLANYENHNSNGPNQWFEEALCETSSLYTLRRMAVTWKTMPPYPHWTDYAKNLLVYADDTMQKTERQLPATLTLAAWFAEHQAHLRKNSIDRELNGLVANQLLPLFENDPTCWDTVRFLNLGDDEHEKSFAAYLASWRDRVPEKHRSFIQTLLKKFGFPADVTVEAARTL